MKLVDEIVKPRLSLVKTRVEFSIELYRNVGKVIEISRSFSFKHKSILLRMLEKIYYSQFFSKVSNLTDIIHIHLKNLAEFSPKRSILQTIVPIIWTKTLTFGSMNGEKKYTSYLESWEFEESWPVERNLESNFLQSVLIFDTVFPVFKWTPWNFDRKGKKPSIFFHGVVCQFQCWYSHRLQSKLSWTVYYKWGRQ